MSKEIHLHLKAVRVLLGANRRIASIGISNKKSLIVKLETLDVSLFNEEDIKNLNALLWFYKHSVDYLSIQEPRKANILSLLGALVALLNAKGIIITSI